MEYLSEIGQHLGLIVGLGLATYWIISRIYGAYRAAKEFVSHVVDERMPQAIHKTLNNGIKSVMREVVDDAIKAHEAKEDRKLDELWSEVRHGDRRTSKRK